MKTNAAAQDFLQALTGCRHHAVIIKGSPDPDALAAACALQCLSAALGNEASIVCVQPVALPQNRDFVRELGIKLLAPSDRHLATATAYSVVDHQDAAPLPELAALPCLIHIDHHEVSADQVPAQFRLVDSKAGAASSLIARLWHQAALPVRQEDRQRMAGALLAGILTDTDRGRLAGESDREAIAFLEKIADPGIVARSSQASLTPEMSAALAQAEQEARIYRDWVISGIGYLAAGERDTIAIVADCLLEHHEDAETVVVYAVIENGRRGSMVLDASMRSRNAGRNLDRLIKRITPHGGGRRHKAAFQIPLDFLSHCHERERLWETLRDATENALITARSKLGYGGFWTRLRRHFLGSRPRA